MGDSDSSDAGAGISMPVVRLLTGVGGCLSMLGATFVIVNYFACRDLKSYSSKLICYLALANFFSGVAFVLAASDVGCLATAVLMQVADVAGFLWTACIAGNMFLLFVQGQREKARKREKYYHLLSWGVPMLSAAVVAMAGCFGPTTTWCWIKDEGVCQVFRWSFFYAPLVVLVLYCAVMYVRIISDLHNKYKRMAENAVDSVEMGEHARRFLQRQRTFQSRLSLYLLVFVVVRSFGLAHRLQTLVFPDSRVWLLELGHAAVVPLHGLLNALIYGVNPRLVRQYKNMFARCCGGIVPVRRRARGDSAIKARYEVDLSPRSRGELKTMGDDDDDDDEFHEDGLGVMPDESGGSRSPQVQFQIVGDDETEHHTDDDDPYIP